MLSTAFCLLLLPGCMGYMVGNRTLYPPDIRTVYVPMFDSTSFRRGLGEEITEAVVKQIELKTPFKVVNTPDADSILSGKLIADTKGVLVKPPTDEQRLIQLNYRVEVSWLDRRGDQIRQTQSLPIPDSMVLIDQPTNYVPEVGQSISTATMQTVNNLAEQIVSLMEAPW
ncbi:MAG TPA: LptE family protein [Pirellulales bacterium]|nr:LptE family protein [Pirellulales bacterium]